MYRQAILLISFSVCAMLLSGCVAYQTGGVETSHSSSLEDSNSESESSPGYEFGGERESPSEAPDPVSSEKNCGAGYDYVDSECLKKVIDPAKIRASASGDDGNVASNVLDGKLTTRWSSAGVGEFIDLDLRDEYFVRSVQIAFYLGNARKFRFKVQHSLDGTIFKDAGSFESALSSQNFQNFAFKEVLARYVRILGEGNSENSWNSYLEVMANKEDAATPSPMPTVTASPQDTPTPSVPNVPNDGSRIPLSDVDIVFGNDFEHRPLGSYSASAMQAEWGIGAGNRLEQALVQSSSNNKYLRVNFPFYDKAKGGFKTIPNYHAISGNQYVPKGSSPADGLGSDAGGVSIPRKLNRSFEELYLGYRMFVPADFNGLLMGKLPGLCGGTCPTGGRTSDPTKDGTTDGFSARFVFSGSTSPKPSIYMYHSDHLVNPPCDGCKVKTGTSFSNVEGTEIKDVRFLKGQWNTLVMRVVMNTLNVANGIVEVWLNGNLIIQKSNIKFRVGKSSNFGIDQFPFQTFYGGGANPCTKSSADCLIDPKNPAKGLITYSNGDVFLLFAPRKNEYLLFDDVVLFNFKAGKNVPRGTAKSPIARKLNLPNFTGLVK